MTNCTFPVYDGQQQKLPYIHPRGRALRRWSLPQKGRWLEEKVIGDDAWRGIAAARMHDRPTSDGGVSGP